MTSFSVATKVFHTPTQNGSACQPPVHILMCTYNGARWVQAQLDSFLRQTHDNWVLWVSDDHSTDGTLDILAAFKAAHPERLGALVSGPRQGAAANFLSLLCHPDLPAAYVALSDQDDVWLPHKLEHAMAQLHGLSDQPCAWSGRSWRCTASLAATHLPAPWLKGASLQNAVVQNIMSGHTLTLNPRALALIRRAGKVDVAHHDWWIYLTLMACGARVLIDPEVVAHYRQHGTNVVGQRQGVRAGGRRFAALANGDLKRWITANLQALQRADLPLSPATLALLGTWQTSGTHGTLRAHGLHRQSRSETALLRLAARLGKL